MSGSAPAAERAAKLSPEVLARMSPAGLAMFVSRGSWRLWPYLSTLNRKLVGLATGRISRLIVEIPVRHGKSELGSRHFPTWFLGNWPDKRIILASYEADFAASWGCKARDELEQFGPAIFGVRVRADRRAANWWEIEGRDGYMATAGVGGPITGKGCHLLIVDDPIKNAEEAASKLQRDKVYDWFRSTAYTRLEPGGACLVIMSRWHEDDLVGRLIRESESGGEPWEVLRLPALAEEGDPLGRAPGEALCPDRYSRDALELIRMSVGAQLFASLYQQRPAPAGGSVYNSEWFRYYKWLSREAIKLDADAGNAILKLEDAVRYGVVDLAASIKKTADYTVVSSWAAWKKSSDLAVLDVDRARREAPDIVPAMRRALSKWNLSFIAVEKAGFQLAIIQEARRAGLPIRELIPDKDKVARALPAAARMEGGHLWLPEAASWLSNAEHELVSLPRGEHDDVADVFAYAVRCQLDWLTCQAGAGALQNPEEREPSRVGLGMSPGRGGLWGARWSRSLAMRNSGHAAA